MRKAVIPVLLVFSMLSLPAMAAGYSSGMGWFGTQVVSSLIHGVIYGVIFKVFHQLGLVPSLIVGAVALGGAYIYYKKRNGA